MSKAHYIIPIFVPHEGCPHSCVFCNQDTITGEANIIDATYTRKTIEEYLKTIKNKDAVIEVSFFGGTFTAINIKKQKELLEVAKEYKQKKLIDFIHLSTRPDYIDHNILKNLKSYSVDVIELGIQSMDTEVLSLSKRGHTAEDVRYASALIKEYGFTLGHQIMLGLPGDTPEKDINTTLEVISMKPDICRIYPALVIKHTEMETMFLRGEYTPYTLDTAVEVSKTLFGMLTSHGINVIRIGLQPTEEINSGKEIVAGPFHPAFRELAEGSLFCDMIEDTASNNDEIKIYVNNKDISKLYANKKQYFNKLKSKIKYIKVIQDSELYRGNVIVENSKSLIKLSVFDYVVKKYYNISKIC
ncbi:MAG: elongator complex protein 3 [Solirubrobacterales bacterium]